MNENGKGGEIKLSAWDWVMVAAIMPGVLILIVITSPLIAALAAYDLVFFGWIRASEDRRRD